jgi:hypothetical protein
LNASKKCKNEGAAPEWVAEIEICIVRGAKKEGLLWIIQLSSFPFQFQTIQQMTLSLIAQ